jgi:Lrp/AsnC family transcriptional regulator
MDNKKFSIDNLDKKILFELDLNSRQSASMIAKKIRVHKNVVNFRINRFIENKIIRQFVAIISPNSLGLTPYKFYFQFQNMTDKKEREILQFIKKIPVYWSAKVSGRWDFIIGVMVRDLKELNNVKKALLKNFGEDIVNKTLSVLVEASYFPRKYLSEKENKERRDYWIGEAKKEDFDDYDLKILKILANNARESIINISSSLNLTEKTVIQRIRELEKRKIILDYRISLNLEKIGYHFFKCFISFKDYNEEEINKLKSYCQYHPNIIHLVECAGDWDLEPELEVENFENFQTILSDIRNKFSKIVKTIETINIIKENSYVCIPEIK